MKLSHIHRRGFTLVELMVVMSIISMLGSVVLATVNPARAQARDSVRTSQVHQIDNAVQLYMASNFRTPDLQGTCAAAVSIQSGLPDSCTASSNAASGSAQKNAWLLLQADLAQFMPKIPLDPCGSSPCTNSSGNPLGYTYIAPAALKYYCAQAAGGSCGITDSNLNSTYTLYAPLEGSGGVAGISGKPSITSFPATIANNQTLSLVGKNFTATGNTVSFIPLPIGSGIPFTNQTAVTQGSNQVIQVNISTLSASQYKVNVSNSYGLSNPVFFYITCANCQQGESLQ